MAIEVVHWNPKRRTRGGLPGRLLPKRPINNFGDMLGPVICREIVRRNGLDFDDPARSARLLTVGSIMHLAKPGDVIWGTGINGKIPLEAQAVDGIDVRATRGPLTLTQLRARGIQAPDVFGDPGLLIGQLWSRAELRGSREPVPLSVVPNFRDLRQTSTSYQCISPRAPLWDCLGRIAASDFVVGSSLHGIIVADALGIPARFVESSVESEFKYLDYYEGTGRSHLKRARTVDEAIAMGPHEPLDWSSQALLSAFPIDLWK